MPDDPQTRPSRMAAVIAALADSRIVPVVVFDDAEQAGPLADALVRGGILSIEVTLRTEAGLGPSSGSRAEPT